MLLSLQPRFWPQLQLRLRLRLRLWLRLAFWLWLRLRLGDEQEHLYLLARSSCVPPTCHTYMASGVVTGRAKSGHFVPHLGHSGTTSQDTTALDTLSLECLAPNACRNFCVLQVKLNATATLDGPDILLSVIYKLDCFCIMHHSGRFTVPRNGCIPTIQ
jgi:hypothetical protein